MVTVSLQCFIVEPMNNRVVPSSTDEDFSGVHSLHTTVPGDYNMVIGRGSLCHHNGCFLLGDHLTSTHDCQFMVDRDSVKFTDCEFDTAVHALHEMFKVGLIRLHPDVYPFSIARRCF